MHRIMLNYLLHILKDAAHPDRLCGAYFDRQKKTASDIKKEHSAMECSDTYFI